MRSRGKQARPSQPSRGQSHPRVNPRVAALMTSMPNRNNTTSLSFRSGWSYRAARLRQRVATAQGDPRGRTQRAGQAERKTRGTKRGDPKGEPVQGST